MSKRDLEPLFQVILDLLEGYSDRESFKIQSIREQARRGKAEAQRHQLPLLEYGEMLTNWTHTKRIAAELGHPYVERVAEVERQHGPWPSQKYAC